MQIVSTFPGGEYHLGGDEVWAVPWANSTTVQKWIATHGLGDGGSGCPDDPTVSCGNIGDIQPYFTRKVSSHLTTRYNIRWAEPYVSHHTSPVLCHVGGVDHREAPARCFHNGMEPGNWKFLKAHGHRCTVSKLHLQQLERLG